MKDVKLKRLTMSSWRGQNHEIKFNGDTTISGINKVGKSTIKDAFLWVLTGYDSNNRLNFNLFDNNHKYTAQDNPVASVEILLSIGGNKYTFKRTAQKGFVRRRGADVYELKGTDNYSFFLDSIELGAGEYKNRVCSLLCDYEALRIMIDTKYFLSMDWKEQRIHLSKMVPSFKESDFGGAYKQLFNELKKYSMEELKAKIQTISSPIKAQLKSLPLTIQALEDNLPDISKAEEAKTEIVNLKKRIEAIDEELNGSYSLIKSLVEKRNNDLRQISLMEYELNRNTTHHEEELFKKVREIENNIKAVEKNNRDISWNNEKNQRQKASIEKEIEQLEKQLPMYDRKREELLKQRDEVKALAFGEELCSLCGQQLPEDQLEKAKERFLEERQAKLNDIIYAGKTNNESKKTAIERIESLRSSLKDIPAQSPLLSVQEFVDEMEKVQESYIKYEDTDEYKKLNAEIELKKSQITSVPNADNEELLREKNDLISQIEQNSKMVGLIEEREKQVRKIDSLKNEMKEAAIALVEQEKLSAEIKDYEEEYAKKVAEHVNRYFKRCKITMVSQDKSGNWVPDCVIKSPDGTVYSTCNGAEKILLGIDVSNAFSEFYDLAIPLFVDDVNLISDYSEIYTVGQQVLLHVSNDTQLTVYSHG